MDDLRYRVVSERLARRREAAARERLTRRPLRRRRSWLPLAVARDLASALSVVSSLQPRLRAIAGSQPGADDGRCESATPHRA